MMKTKNYNSKNTGQESHSNSFPFKEKRPVLTILLKLFFFSAIILGCIIYSDVKGFFNPNDANNHTFKKWNSYYDFIKNNEVDIILIGNSRLYTGINPKNLSAALGVNAFILASPGTAIVDFYYVLKEAAKHNKPKLVVVETYGIKAINQHKLSKAGLSDQFKSFSARYDFWIKLFSTPVLFAPQNYVYAWSNSIRNHDFLYKNYNQVKKNIKISKTKKIKDNKLYLGRFVRFKTGLEDTTLAKYEKFGATVDGTKYNANNTSQEYVNKIIDFCETQNIELMFLTLPMYEKHIKNYKIEKEKLGKQLGKYACKNHWLDLQYEDDYQGFNRHSFENTIEPNQHMTYNGSLLATYKLADFIRNNKVKLPNRSNDAKWKKIFYGEEGFFENYSPKPNDENNIILYNDKTNDMIEEVILLKRKEYYNIICKIKPKNQEQFDLIASKKIRIICIVKNEQGVLQNVFIDLIYDMLHSTKERKNFATVIKPIEIINIINFQLLPDNSQTMN